MKKRILIASLIVAFIMSIGAISVCAQNENNEMLDNGNTIKVLDKKISIYNYLEDKRNVQEKQIISMFNAAMNAFNEEMVMKKDGTQDGTYNYYGISTDYIFFYEQTELDPNNPIMIVYECDNESLNDIQNKESGNSKSGSPIFEEFDEGFGGRAKISSTSRNYLTTTVKLPTTSNVSVNNGETCAYIYGGFKGGIISGSSSTYEADAGMLYYENSSNQYVWRPYMLITKSTGTQWGGKFLSPYNNVWGENGYLPDTNVVMTIHPKNDQTGTAGSIRLKLYGTARYENASGDGSNTTLTSILEAADNGGNVVIFNISSVANHKLLATIAMNSGNDNYSTTGTNWAKFTNTKIGTTIISPSSMSFQGEHVSFSTTSTSVTIDVDHSYNTP